MKDFKKYLNEKQDPKVVEKIHTKVKELLTSKESIEYIAVQKKPFINLWPASLVLTNRRLIVNNPRMFGLNVNFQDYLWKDIIDCHIYEKLLGVTFSVRLVNRRLLNVTYLPKSQARMLYRFAQEKEEEMEDYRRQRKLEESRASAGGVYMSSQSNDQPKAEKEDPVASLKKLKGLLEDELISQEEFDQKKQEILAKL